MASTFTWLDYSEHERRRMLDVIELFGERTTRDELGLGSVRDAFADSMFPGTSTIQTRARYFLFVPWVYTALEEKPVPSSKIRERARKDEIAVMRAIEDSDDTVGLIGRRAKENIQRLPSSIYWLGLLTWGVRRFPGSQDAYHRSIDLFRARRKARPHRRHERDGEAEDDPDLHNWDPGLPAPPEGFPHDGVSFDLTRIEASYLRERVLTNCTGSLLAFLLRERVPVDEATFAWHLPSLPDDLAEVVCHGRNFSEVMHGAQLLYNLVLAEKKNGTELVDHYRQLLDEWATNITVRHADFDEWDRKAFWRTVRRGNPRVSQRAVSFIDRWIDKVLDGPSIDTVLDDRAARNLVEHREMQLKGGLARVRGGRPLELWNEASGTAQLDLRWGAARGIVSDILAGLEAEDA